jgi:hypothetical protein
MSTYAKFIAALSAALATAVTVTADGSLTLNDALVIAVAAVGALAVYVVPNRPAE